MKHIEHQGKKFQDFLEKKKKESRRNENEPTFTLQVAADKLGVSRRTLYYYFDAERLSADVVNSIVAAFGVSEEEIFGGKLTAGDNTIKTDHIKINNPESNVNPISFNTVEPNMYLVPLKAQGGFMIGYEREVYLHQLEKVAFPMVRGECFGFEVDGLSMLPEFLPGDYVVSTPVESLEHLVKGKVYIFQTIDGILLKEFGGFSDENAILISINDDYDPMTVPLKNIKKVYLKEFKITRN